MKQYTTFAEMEALLRTAINMKGHTVKAIGAATGIRPDTLYKWKTTDVHLSPPKADALLLYFIENEPNRLELAETVIMVFIPFWFSVFSFTFYSLVVSLNLVTLLYLGGCPINSPLHFAFHCCLVMLFTAFLVSSVFLHSEKVLAASLNLVTIL